jgi:hypothetical protein
MTHADPAMLGPSGYERNDNDLYPTPQENVDCVAHFILFAKRIVWEPACGLGHISKRIAPLCAKVFSTDLIERDFGIGGIDFLKANTMPPGTTDIVTNPPFADLAEQFIRKALELTKPVGGRVAMFLRNEYDMVSTERDDLFEGHPAYAMKICVTKRPRWIEGSKGAPRHSYAWYIWDWSKPAGQDPVIRYIHPKNAHPLVLNA